MLTSKEIKARAWRSLKGRYFEAILVLVIITAVNSIAGDKAHLLGTIFIETVLSIGLANYFIKNTAEKPSFTAIYSCLTTSYGRNLITMILMYIKVALWSLLLIVPGIIKAIEYSLIPYILAEDPQISCKDAFKKAKALMKGNKWRLCKLILSFTGWFAIWLVVVYIGYYLYATYSFSIALLFLTPYLSAALAEFYIDVKNNHTEPETVQTEAENIQVEIK